MSQRKPNVVIQSKRRATQPVTKLPKARPASLAVGKKTLAQSLGVRPNTQELANKLEQVVEKKKEERAGPAKRLPVPKAINIMSDDPIRDYYLERGKSENPDDVVFKDPDEVTAEEYRKILQNSISNPSALEPETEKPQPFLSKLKKVAKSN